MSASKKLLAITTTDGSIWGVPAEIVAHNRADHYREDGYQEEFDYTLNDRHELIDWAANNMNWEDVSKYAVKMSEPEPPDFQESWMNGEKEVVDCPEAIKIELPELK